MTTAMVRGHDTIWGEVVTDDSSDTKVYITKRNGGHFCWKHRGYGIQYDLFQSLMNAGVDEIRIRTPDTILISSIETWDKKGIIDVLRFEDGEQIFLPEAMNDSVVRLR